MQHRDNGLAAESWLPLADIEPALTDNVLQALAGEGIAAFAESRTMDLEPLLGATLHAVPSDRISVDRERRRDARVLLDRLLPELRDELGRAQRDSEDQAWSSIVSQLDQPGDEGISWPDPDEVTAELAGSAAQGADRGEASESADDWGQTDSVPFELDDEGDDTFVPPEAPPIPTADAVTRAAWIGLIGGPLFMILGVFFDWSIDGLAGLLAVGAFVAGFVTLIARMKDRPPLDESGDDGARI